MKYFLILFLILLASAAFIVIRERTLKEYTPPNLRLAEYKSAGSEFSKGSANKRKSVIILDIAELSYSTVQDTAATPGLSKMVQSSKVYDSTINLSPNRITSLKSFFECLSPYKFNNGKEPYRNFKDIISDSLRNSSAVQEYRRSGYITKLYTADSTVYRKTSGYFMESRILKTKEEVLEELYKDMINDKDTVIFYYADISSGYNENENYILDIDHQITQLKNEIEGKLKLEPLMLLISTQRNSQISNAVSIFYQNQEKYSLIEQNVALTDIAKTLLNHSEIDPPNYFGGYDLDNDEENVSRDYFAGICGDTLLLFNEEYIYKQLKYSEEYYYFDRKQMKDVTNSFIGINEKFHELLPKYFGGDYAKFIILKNNGASSKIFKMNIRSNRRFEEFSGLKNYYRAEKTSGRYSKDLNIELAPGVSDTITVYYSHLYQNFDFTFGDQYGLSYGSAGVNAGTVKNFNENSYYGMKYYFSGSELFKGYDIRIFNIRINY